MTRYGLEVFLFVLAVLLSIVSLVLSPFRERTELRLESPDVVISNPYWKKIRELSSDFTRTRMIHELLRLGGYLSREGFLVENADREQIVLKITKFGVKYEFLDRNTARIIPYSIVVLIK